MAFAAPDTPMSPTTSSALILMSMETPTKNIPRLIGEIRARLNLPIDPALFLELRPRLQPPHSEKPERASGKQEQARGFGDLKHEVCFGELGQCVAAGLP
jgi:hypothetical protein